MGETEPMPVQPTLQPLSPTPEGSFGREFIWVCLTASVAAIPLLIDPRSSRCFEGDKAAFFRSLALLAGGGLALQSWRDRSWVRILRHPIALVAFALSAASVVAALLGVHPAISLWGSYARSTGAYLWLAGLLVFVAAASAAATPMRRRCLISLVLLPSLPCSLYALMQHWGLEVLPWRERPADLERVFSTAGNPTFLAGYLLLVVPMCLSRLVGHGEQLLRARRSGAHWLRPGAMAGAYAILLAMQVAAMACTSSRGAMLGLGVGVTAFLLLLAASLGKRRLALAVWSVVAACAVALAAANVYSRATGRPVPGLGRMAKMLHPQGTGRARILYWEGSAGMFQSDPLRLLIGYGPDTTYLAYARFAPAELAHLAGPERYLDRLHNDTLDMLATVGLIGAALLLLLFLLPVWQILDSLGQLPPPRRRRFWMCSAGGALAGAVGGLLLPAPPTICGLTVPMGTLAAVLVFASAPALQKGRPRMPAPACDLERLLLCAGLFAALTGHWVDVHLGIATVATRMLWWVFLGVVVGMHRRIAGDTGPAADSPPREGLSHGHPETPNPAALPAVVSSTSAAAIVLVFGFYQEGFGWPLEALVLAGLLAAAYLGGLLALAEEGRLRQRVAGFTVGVAIAPCLFAGAYVAWSSWRPESSMKLVDFALQQSHGVTILYVSSFLVLLLSAWRAAKTDRSPRGGLRRIEMIASAALLAAVAGVIWLTNLEPVRADRLAGQASRFRGLGQWEAAAALYDQAAGAQPGQDEYWSLAGQCRAMAAARPRDATARREMFAQAAGLIGRAISLSPRDFRHHVTMGELVETWAGLSSGEERIKLGGIAAAAYRQAIALSPSRMGARDGLARLHLELGQHRECENAIAQTLAWDPQWAPAHLMRARLRLAQGDAAGAWRELEWPIPQDRTAGQAWSQKATILRQLGRDDLALDAALRAVEAQPQDPQLHVKLAWLYRETAQPERAMAELLKAADLASPLQREEVLRLARSWREPATSRPE